MTVSDQKTETWKPIPGAGYYEASHRGHVRSVDRTINGRFYRGIVLKSRTDPDGYLRVNITNDAGERQHNESVARLVLLAHDPDGYRPGMHACHGPGGTKDNRWPENIRWDTPEANREEALAVRLANSPPKQKPPKVCPRCSKEHQDKGRNCHQCVVKLGVQAAQLRAGGMTFREAGDLLRYAPADLDVLAERYGGLRYAIDHAAVTSAGHSTSSQSWLRRVINRREGFRQNSDGA